MSDDELGIEHGATTIEFADDRHDMVTPGDADQLPAKFERS